MTAGDRHSALVRLDVLVGRWTVQPRVAGVGSARMECAWVDDGAYLRQYTDADPARPEDPWRGHAPFPTTALIGLDDTADAYTVLYADARGVHRVYAMTFADGTWTQLRLAPGFNQRFTGTVSADGTTIDARWEMSPDGTTWTTDFEIVYTRQN
jgi:hypothetical protein